MDRPRSAIDFGLSLTSYIMKDIRHGRRTMEIKDIHKRYKNKEVLKGVNFHAEHGEIIGVLGGNGSGKTTLLNILSGILKADRGSFVYDGHDLLTKQKVRRVLVGLIPQGNPLIEELTAYDNLLLWYDKAKFKTSVQKGLIRRLKVDEFLNMQVSKLSGGMKKRLSIACAVAHQPRILLMDEPSAALDLVCKEYIHDYIREFSAAGGIVILVTHDESELSLCHRHYVLREGKFTDYVYDGDSKALAKLIG